MNKKNFLDEIKKHFSQSLKGYHLVKKYKFDKKQQTQALSIVTYTNTFRKLLETIMQRRNKKTISYTSQHPSLSQR